MNITLAEGVNVEEVPTFHCVSQVVLSSVDLVRGPAGVSRCLLKGETQCGQAPLTEQGPSELSPHSSWLIKILLVTYVSHLKADNSLTSPSF